MRHIREESQGVGASQWFGSVIGLHAGARQLSVMQSGTTTEFTKSVRGPHGYVNNGAKTGVFLSPREANMRSKIHRALQMH
jgi:hypothetical protein